MSKSDTFADIELRPFSVVTPKMRKLMDEFVGKTKKDLPKIKKIVNKLVEIDKRQLNGKDK